MFETMNHKVPSFVNAFVKGVKIGAETSPFNGVN